MDKLAVVTAWAEFCSGPGWSNRLVWVLLRDLNGRYSVKAIQPSEQTADMMDHIPYSAMATEKLTAAVRRGYAQ